MKRMVKIGLIITCIIASGYIGFVAGNNKDICVSFNDDPNIHGTWQTVDFVGKIDDFKPNKRSFKEELYLKKLDFLEGGKTSNAWEIWSKGITIHQGDKTIAHYMVKKIDGADYMFYEWMSGDVTLRGKTPKYYVLRKISSK